jgi:hypothetical protein
MAFLASSIAIFALVFLIGTTARVTELPMAWRQGIASLGLLALALIDILAVKKGIYCPIGWRRQTPKSLMRRYSIPVVLAAWGLDTGLAITTFRVAAVTWGAFLVAFLCLSEWWIGIGYGLGFVVPFTILVWTHRVGRMSISEAPDDPGLEALLDKRPAMQLGSASLMVLGGVIMFIEVLA